MTLTEFLTARLGEDEQAAQEAVAALANRPSSLYAGTPTAWIAHVRGVGSPERVLREVEVKRALLKEHALTASTDRRAYDEGRWGWPGEPKAQGCERCDDWDGWVNGSDGCPTLRHLATAYADHPDYDEAWRP